MPPTIQNFKVFGWACRLQVQSQPRSICGVFACCLTPRSSGAPTAGHQGPAGGTLYIFASPGLASCRCRPLSSNVRPHKFSLLLLPEQTHEHRSRLWAVRGGAAQNTKFQGLWLGLSASGSKSATQHLRCVRLLPNPSLKRSANGRPPGPGRRYVVHFRQPGPGTLPSSPA